MNKFFSSVLLGSLLFVSFISAGIPARPAQQVLNFQGLTKRTMTWAASPVDNPLKGLIPYVNTGSNYSHSIDFDYIEMDQIMTNWNTFNWTELENSLNDAKNDGNQLVFRVMVSWEYDSRGFPPFLNGKVNINSNHPDWNDPDMLEAGRQLITALGKKYDGDPRIAYIEAGLVGYFGEWHTNRGGQDINVMPTIESQQKILSWYDSSFNKTKIAVRYATVATAGDKWLGGIPGWILKTDFGMHDDSYGYKGYTLPQSMGGFDYSFLQYALNRQAENQWIKGPMLGEVRPEVGDNLFSSGSNRDNPWSILEMSHTTAMRMEDNFRIDTDDKKNWVRKMGYDFHVSEVFYNDAVGSQMWLGVRIENRGVAPMYYKWPVVVALRLNGAITKEWQVDWDLTKVLPTKIRTFKTEWKTPDSVMSFGYPTDFEAVVDIKSLKETTYELLIRVKNPLEDQTSKAKRLRFANATQETEWLKLGNVKLDHSIPFFKPTSLSKFNPAKIQIRKGFLEYQFSKENFNAQPFIITLQSINGKIISKTVHPLVANNRIPLTNLVGKNSGSMVVKIQQGNKLIFQSLVPIL